MADFSLEETVEVRCYRCKEYISNTNIANKIKTALCVECQALEEGIILTAAELADIKALRGAGNMSQPISAFYIPVDDPMGTKVLDETATDEEIRTNRLQYFGKALMKAARTIVDAIKPIPESKQLATSKRAKRVFDLPIDDKE